MTDEQLTWDGIYRSLVEDKTMDFGNFRMAVRMIQHTIGQNALK